MSSGLAAASAVRALIAVSLLMLGAAVADRADSDEPVAPIRAAHRSVPGVLTALTSRRHGGAATAADLLDSEQPQTYPCYQATCAGNASCCHYGGEHLLPLEHLCVALLDS
eukprot:SAG31_NODE_9470_length_1272_cov_1.606138_2_plen_111_part_00